MQGHAHSSNGTPETLPLTGIVGIAIDLSGSMRNSVNNSAAAGLSRYASLREMIVDLRAQVRKSVTTSYPAGLQTSLEIFAYAFGIREDQTRGLAGSMLSALMSTTDHQDNMIAWDLLSLLKIMLPDLTEVDAGSLEVPDATPDPRSRSQNARALASLAREHGHAGWDRVALAYLDDQQVADLTRRLLSYPEVARRLARLIPEASDEEISIAVSMVQLRRKNPFGALRMAGNLGATARQATNPHIMRRLRALRQALIELSRPISSDETEQSILTLMYGQLMDFIRTELAMTGDTTMRLEELLNLLIGSKGPIPDLEPFVFGSTPLRQTMKIVTDRLRREMAQRPGIPATLLVLTDGESTDGSPARAFAQIKGLGVTVVACYFTDHDLAEPRTLYATMRRDWDRGARTLFEAASKADHNHPYAARLRKKNWRIEPEGRYFIQVNNSTLVSELLQSFILHPEPPLS
jgi:hypothetical protein